MYVSVFVTAFKRYVYYNPSSSFLIMKEDGNIFSGMGDIL